MCLLLGIATALYASHLWRMKRLVFLSAFLIQAVCHPAYAVQQSSISGVKAGFGLFTGTFEALSVRTAALSGLSQSRPLTSPVEIYEWNRLQNQNADFVK